MTRWAHNPKVGGSNPPPAHFRHRNLEPAHCRLRRRLGRLDREIVGLRVVRVHGFIHSRLL